MRPILSITIAAAAAAQLVACTDLPTRPSGDRPSKALVIGPPIYPQPLNPNDYVAITAGGYHTCVQRRNGNVYCWGANNFGQSPVAVGANFGNCPGGACVKTPSFVMAAKQVSAGFQHTCLLSVPAPRPATGAMAMASLASGTGARAKASRTRYQASRSIRLPPRRTQRAASRRPGFSAGA